MIRWRASALLGALLVGAALTPAVAGPPARLTLSSAGTAEATLVLRSAVVLDNAATRVAGPARISGWAITALDPSRSLVAAEVRVRGWRAAFSSRSSAPVRLAAGRYRVVVFADRPTTVTIPLRGGPSQALRVASRTTARALLVDLLAGRPVVAPETRTTVRYGGSFIVSQTYFASRAHQAEVVSQCFAPAADGAQTCVGRPGFNGAVTSVGSVGDGYTSQFTAAYGDDLPRSQPVDALVQAVDVDLPSAAEQLVVTA